MGNNDVAAGVNRVATYFGTLGEGGVPQLIITRNCVNLIQELQRYRWATYANKRIGNQNNKKELAHKKDDHAADSLRYFIMSRPDLAPYRPSIISPRNTLDAPVSATLARFAEPFEKPVGQTDWNVETSSDEILGGIW